MSIIFGVTFSKTLYLLAGAAACVVIAVVGGIKFSRFGDDIKRWGEE